MSGPATEISPRPVRTIDLSSDVGEGSGADGLLIPLLTSVNIACGAHAGDVETMRATVAQALACGVAIGAHPGYRDRANFGRVSRDVPPEDLRRDIAAQIETLGEVARTAGADITYVKAHGALYNQAESDARVAATIVRALQDVDASLVLVASPGSAMARVATGAGVRVVREGFVDRTYECDGTLRSRRLPDAVITDPVRAAAQARLFAERGCVRTWDGALLTMTVDTLCVHGDTPGAPAIAAAVRDALAQAGIALRAFTR